MRLLGIVDWTNVDRAGKPIAGLIPLFETTKTPWRKINANEFPAEGQVFWFRAEGKKDELVYFNVEDNDDERYEFKVSDHHVAIEVRDFRKLGSPEVVRRSLISGLKWVGLVPGRQLVWCAGDLIVGPIKLVPNASGLFTFDYAQKHEIPCYVKKEVEVAEVPSKPFKRFVLAEDCPLVASSYVDWDEDNLVVKRAIKWAVERSSQDNSAISLTQTQIRAASDYLTKSGGDAKLRLQQYRLERALKVFADVHLADAAAATAVEELQRLPKIAQQLAQLRETVSSETQKVVGESLKREVEALENARHERAVIEADTKAAQESFENVRAQKLEAVKELETEVNNRISEILDKPSELLADVAILNTVFQRPSRELVTQRPATLAQPISWPTTAQLITEFKEFRKVLVKSSRAEGVSPDALTRIHAAIKARLMPLVVGPRALRALHAYARVTCGGRIFRIHATPSLFEPSDIFGKIDVPTSRFIPHTAGLIDIFKSAEKNEGLALVVIDGANRAPMESYLLPLLSCALTSSPLRIFHPSAVNPDDTYRDCFNLRWPRNLLLSATLVEGATTLPVTPDIWTSAIAVETDSCTGPRTESSEVFEIDLSLELKEMPDAHDGVSDELLETLPEYSPYSETLNQFSTALSCFEPSKSKLETALIESLVSPLLVTLNNDDSRESAVARITKGVPGFKDSSEIEPLIERLRRRLT